MFNIKQYREHPAHLSDLLPWAALIAPGVLLNKDGSFLRTLAFRGPDLESSTESELVAIIARLNNALKRFGSGWALFVEARREPYSHYPTENFFPDELSRSMDHERETFFSDKRDNFESRFFLTLQYLPPEEKSNRLQQLLISSASEKVENNYEAMLHYFQLTSDRFFALFSDFTFEASFLEDDALLTYLHSTISTKNHPIKTPESPMYLDAFLADTPLVGGLEIQLGDKHLAIASVLGFPQSTFPALLDQLNHLPLTYRWVTRFIPLDKAEAEAELKSYKRQWFAKRKGIFNLLQEVFTKSESALMDTASLEKARDADEAFRELSEDYVAYGYYTAVIVVEGDTRREANQKIQAVERVINGMGFTTITESINAVEAWLSSLPGHTYANIRKPLLHTLNLAHLMPFSAVWSGQEKNKHLNAPPLFYAHTHGRTPFRFVHHIGDVGHMMVIGPTGSGKSVLLAFMALQFRRYANAQIFIFDKGGSFKNASQAVKGAYYELSTEYTKAIAFQPLAHIDEESERVWASEWIQSLLVHEQIEMTPAKKQALWDALLALAHSPQVERTLTGLRAFIQNIEIRQALSHYTLEGPYGHLLDADHETALDHAWECYEMEALMNAKSIIAPVLLYLFHRIEKRLHGEPSLFILDEAWLFLDNVMFADKIREWLKTLRKKNVSVIFATQSVEDALASRIAPALIESCPQRIFLPNDRAFEPAVRQRYEQMGLNEKQLSILANAIPKQHYYYQSRLGNRLFDLALSENALRYCTTSPAEEMV